MARVKSNFSSFVTDFFKKNTLGRDELCLEYFWPLDKTDRLWIIENIISSNKKKIFEWVKSIEVKMIYIFPILLEVRIRRGSHSKAFILHMFTKEVSYKCGFSGSKISKQKNSRSWSEGEDEFFQFNFCNNWWYVKRKLWRFLHEIWRYAMLNIVY